MEKYVWEVKYKIIAHQKCWGHTVDTTWPKYIYASEQWIEKLARDNYVLCTTYEEFIKAVDENKFPHCYVGETLFRKIPYVGLIDRINGDIKFREKLFIQAECVFTAKKCNGTIKEYANDLSADDFIEYCMDKGIIIKETWLE